MQEPMSDITIKMLARAIDALEELDKALGQDWYVSSLIKVTHRDGWSPGKFSMAEDWVQFIPDYQDEA